MATQLITPNPNIACSPGMCLVYVRETFGIGAKHSTASEGWNASTRKHEDKEFPELWVPLWFFLKDETAGHVALRQPDGSIWSASHPSSDRPVHHASLAAIEEYYGGRLHYLGWTEDIEDTPVVKLQDELLSASAVELQAAPIDGPAIMLSMPPAAPRHIDSRRNQLG